MFAVGAVGKFGFEIAFSPSQQKGLDALAQAGKIFVVGGAAVFVELMEFAVKPEDRAQ